MSDVPGPGPRADPGPVPPPRPGPERDDRAVLHRTEDTRTYPCRQCGAPLEFDITTQRLACRSCGASHEIDDGHLPAPAERDLRSAVAALRAAGAEHAAQGVSASTTGDKEVVCQSCGGHTTFSGTLTATRCPYCATPIQRDDVHDAPARLAVDGVLPFRVDERTARDALERWIHGRRFAPREFKRYKQTGSFTSVYTAYFTYDADTTTDYVGKRGDTYTVTVGSGDNRRTETRVRWSHRSGTVGNRFDDLAVLANTGFDQKRITALEPWPTAAARPFSPEYVAGHLCRTYDHDAEQCFVVAEGRMEDDITRTVKADIGGDQQRISRMSTHFHSLTYKHLLLPIWLLTVIYEGAPFQVFINGVTGEVQGDRPWSKVKIALAVLAALLVVSLVVLVVRARGS